MARMPGALWKPLPRPSKTAMSRYDLVVIHTMVGSLAGTDGYFRRLTNGVNSHFGTGGHGEKWQWVDTAVRSGANAAGNHRAITVENADMGPGFPAWDTGSAANVPAFTDDQCEANAEICAWANLEHGVPLTLARDSLPTSRGIAYHQLGCDPYRLPGGELWSSSYGKVCPAWRRIAQVPEIVTRAQQMAGGAPPPQEEDDDMFIAMVGRQPYLKDGLHYQALADDKTVDGLKAAGVKVVPVGEKDHERWVAGIKAATGVDSIVHLDRMVGDEIGRRQPPAA